MPLDFENSKECSRPEGYDVVTTNSGHYRVIDSNGVNLIGFAVGHGRNRTRGEVLDVYLRKVQRAIESHEQRNQNNEET